MATISADGQSFLLNNKRVWVVGGHVGYAGVPESLWRERLRRAAEAGLNTIVVPVVWSQHERTPGKYSFEGSDDVGTFIRLAGELGLYVIVQAGPVVSTRHSLGGMPAHLLTKLSDGERLRTGDSEFLHEASKFLGRLAKEIAPLQATRSGDNDPDARLAGKPVIAVQVEHQWRCGHEALATQYLNSLVRYLREGGLNVPILNLNNMYAEAEGAIESWAGYADLHAVTRQLRSAWPDDPSIIGEALATTAPVWSEKRSEAKTPEAVLRALAEVCAGGGQFCIGDFAPSAPRGFEPGRYLHGPSAFAGAAPARDFVAEDGSVGPSYSVVRRLCTFASSFGRVLASAETDGASVVLSPKATASPVVDERTGERASTKAPIAGVTVEHLRGAAGSVAFVLADDQAKSAKGAVMLTLPAGVDLRLELGRSSAAWVLLDTHLHGNQRLDFAAFSAFTRSGSTLVLYGPSGAEGFVSINGNVVQLTAPRGKTPVVETIDKTTVVLCNEAQLDATVVHDGVVFVGASRYDEEAGEPRPAAGFKTVTAVDQGGGTRSLTPGSKGESKGKAKLSEFGVCSASGHLDGTSDRYARIDGPATLESLGTPTGYGWMRVRFKSKATKRSSKVGFFHAADRLLVSLDGSKPVVAGLGPGASGHVVSLPLKKQEQTLVALVDNLGRFCEGMDMREPKGLFGGVHVVEPLKASVSVETSKPFDVLGYRAPLDGVHAGDTTNASRLTWTFKHLKKTPVVLHIAELHWHGVVFVNGEPAAAVTPGRPLSVEFDNASLKRGQNEVQVALIGDNEHVSEAFERLKKLTSMYEATETLTEKAEFAFAGWEAPKASAFESIGKTAMSGAAGKAHKGSPTWWRATLDLDEAALAAGVQLSMSGMSKGQLLVNGENVCRYCVQTQEGKAIPPLVDYWVPPDVLRAGSNEVVMFDEHGCSPSRVSAKCGALNG